MKKYSIFMLGALAMAAASCEDSIDFDAPLQSNPQGPVYEAGDIAAEVAGPIASGTLDLNNYAEATELEVVKISQVDTIPAGATIGFKYEIAANPEFNGARTLNVTVANNIGYIDPQTLDTYHLALFGKSPKPKTVYYRIPMYVNVDGVDYRWGGTDAYVAQGQYQEVCVDAGFTISDAYYFIGNLNNWQLDETMKFAHSSADVYDDPVFNIVLDVAEGNSYWKIAPQEAIDAQEWSLLYGPETDGDTSMEGLLVEGGNAGCIAEAGTYKLTINMETMEYKFEVMAYPQALAFRDQAFGWGYDDTQCIAAKNDEGFFAGVGYIDPIYGFKLTDAATGNDWVDGKQWGADSAEPGVLVVNGGNIEVDQDGNPITATALYWVTADLKNMTYTVTEITSIGVIGGFSGWDQNAPVEMQPTDNPMIWSARVADLNGEWKIIINHDWAYNYGGTITDLVPDGGNISGYDGMYQVSIDFTGHFPVIKVEAIN